MFRAQNQESYRRQHIDLCTRWLKTTDTLRLEYHHAWPWGWDSPGNPITSPFTELRLLMAVLLNESYGVSPQISPAELTTQLSVVGWNFVEMSHLAAYCIYLVAAFLAFKWIRKTKRNPRNLPLPPGPKPLPVVGNLLDLPRSSEWLTVTKWKQVYGEFFFELS